MKIARFGVSIDEELLRRFDRYVEEQGFPTRSEALKNMMRNALTKNEWTKGDDVAGCVSFAYDHHKPGVVDKLLNAQHEYGKEIVCSQHAHLDRDLCMETIVVRGRAAKIEELLNRLRQVKGLQNVELTVVCEEREDGHAHAHAHDHDHDRGRGA